MKRRIPFRRFADESGQALVVTALCMTVLLGFVGLVVDVGHLRLQKRNLQAAADAAALAAARQIRVCGVNNYNDGSCPYMVDAAKSALTENGYSAVTAQSSVCSNYQPGTDTAILINKAPCLNSSDPNYKKLGYVEVVVSKTETTWFSRLFGLQTVPISARAEATRILSPPCVYALDPHGSSALSILAGLGVKSNCAMIVESDSDTAMTCTLGIGINVPRINITGGAGSGLLNGLLCGSYTSVRTHVPVPTPADPLAYLSTPSTANDPCGSGPSYSLFSTTYNGSSSTANVSLTQNLLSGGLLGNITFNPGVYCGGINILLNVATTITFNPGVYILRPSGGNGGLSITAGGVLSAIKVGNGGIGGVTFYNQGPTINSAIGGFNINLPTVLGDFDLHAPTSGEYSGVLFFQDKTNAAQDSFLAPLLSGGSSALSLGTFDGAIYAPNATVFYGVSAISGNNNILVAKDISFLAGVLSTFGTSTAPSNLGSPLVGDDAVLVQ